MSNSVQWRPRIALRTQLAARHDGERRWTEEYGRDGRLVFGTRVMDLHTDQICRVHAVVDHSEGVVKEVLYDGFGRQALGSNLTVRIPLGFAGPHRRKGRRPGLVWLLSR